MMSDLIRRQDAIECCRNEWEEEVEERLRLLPSAERKRGEWMYLYEDNYKCSICGSWWCCTDSQIDEMNFCPNCGSEMRGDTDER